MAQPVTITMRVDRFSTKVARFIQTQMQTADRIVFETAANVKATIQEGWPVAAIGGGTSRAAWNGPTPLGPGHYQVSNPLGYPIVIEYGGYPGVGPKTEQVPGFTLPGGIQVAGGIFPTQVPAAPVRRALSHHRNDIQRRLAQAVRASWRR